MALENIIEDDPPARVKAGVGGVAPWIVGGGVPAGAGSAVLHVPVEVVVVKEGVTMRRTRSPGSMDQGGRGPVRSGL